MVINSELFINDIFPLLKDDFVFLNFIYLIDLFINIYTIVCYYFSYLENRF